MKLWEVTLPTTNNAGQLTTMARIAFEERLLQRFGGFSSCPVKGAWYDAGKLYRENNVVYRIASEQATQGSLAALAQFHFPDQLAIFVACVGEAWIVERYRAEGDA